MAGTPLTGASVPLGTMTVGDQVGVGGFGVVHKATLAGINHRFAVKFLHPSTGVRHAGKSATLRKS